MSVSPFLLGGRAATGLVLLALIGLLLAPDLALAQLEKSTQAARKVNDWLWIICPVIGLIAGMIVGLLYAFDVVRKETFYQWAVGLTFAGAIAGGIVKLIF